MLPPISEDLSGSSGSNNVMSPQLRANFEALRKLKQQRDEEGLGVEDEGRPKKRNNTGQDAIESNLDQAQALAVATYFMMEDEISRMQNAVAELEALLAATRSGGTQQQQAHDFDNDAVVSDSE